MRNVFKILVSSINRKNSGNFAIPIFKPQIVISRVWDYKVWDFPSNLKFPKIQTKYDFVWFLWNTCRAKLWEFTHHMIIEYFDAVKSKKGKFSKFSLSIPPNYWFRIKTVQIKLSVFRWYIFEVFQKLDLFCKLHYLI